MTSEVDPMVALVESWDTYLVPTAQQPQNTATSTREGPSALLQEELDALLPSRTYLSDAVAPFASLMGDLYGQAPPSAPATTAEDTPPLLWLLTLVSRNVELLRAAAHLFLQFNAQFATLADQNERAINALRERHQQQLASLLEVADSHTASDMIVDSTVTERVVHQQEQELDCLERECAVAERRLEQQLQATLYTFLNTSAPDAVAAANRKDDAVSWTDGDGLYRAEVDVSRFAEVRKDPLRNPLQSRSAVSPFAPLRLVPVRTIKLNNEVGNASASAATSPSRKRTNDVTMQPIILDVSPLSGLTRCLTSCSGTQPGAVSSSVSSAAEEHLLRLAHTRHSVLLLIGSEAAALDVVATCKAPELLLGAAHSCQEGFTNLPDHPVLKVLFTTRLWGANVVLLWNPSQPPRTPTAAEAVVEDALQLAYAWDADMFSVAVLEGARLPQSARGPPSLNSRSSGSSSSGGHGAANSGSPSAAFLAGQAVSAEVLRQLRNGVTRELLETAGTRRSRRWQGSVSWMQLGGGLATTAGTHMCPRAVGVLYAHQAAAAAAAVAEVAGGDSGSAASSAAASPVVAAGSSASFSASSFRGPPVTFNTPLAIRAFLPLPEEYFVKERPRSGAGGGDSGGGGGARGGTHLQASRGQAAQGGRGAGATPSDTEDSGLDGANVSHGSFTAATASRVPTDDLGDERRPSQRESMGLESLIYYAFGEFAEAL